MTSSDEQRQEYLTSGPYGGVFDLMPGDPEVDREFGDAAFVRQVLAFEAAVARAQAQHGVIPIEAGDAIAGAAVRMAPDLRRIGLLAERSATPVIEIVEQLRSAVGPQFAGLVHRGLTSQDCVDTAFALMQAAVLDIVGPRIALVIGRLSRVAEQYAATPMVARTLGQAAAPTTFGWKVCGWIEGLELAAINLGRIREMLAIQAGGAAGDLAGFGSSPHPMLADVADSLELGTSRIPWHTERSRVLHGAAACVQVINACAKIAGDVVAMTSSDLGELSLGKDPRQARRGGSSAMPHKRNPAAAVLIRSAAVSAPGLLATIAAAGVQEHERAAGAWQSEWRTIRELLHLMGGATLELALLEQDLDVQADRMAANLARADVGTDAGPAERRCYEYLQRFRD